jgi:uncharacterized protein (TIGR00369 family)
MDVTDRAAQYAPLPENRMKVWGNFGKWDTTWFPKYLGIELEEARLDYARMRLKYKPEFNQPAGVVHGGVIASLIDTVVVPAVGGGYDEPRQMFTIDIQIRYLAAIIQQDLVAEGWIEQRGRSIVYCNAEVRAAGSNAVAASAYLTYKVSSKPMVME